MATRHVLTELGDAYRRRHGKGVSIEAVGGVDVIRRVQQGEPFDFVALADDAIGKLALDGQVDANTRTPLARSGVAVAVAAGASRPDIGDESALRNAVLRARSIGYSTGPSGAHLKRLFERWGIAEAIAPRIVQAAPGVPVASLVVRGEVELGFQQLSEMIHVPGIDVIGPLPLAVQALTLFSAAVCNTSTQADATKALLAFLASAETQGPKRRHGMEPA